jgi:hypothetical protein
MLFFKSNDAINIFIRLKMQNVQNNELNLFWILVGYAENWRYFNRIIYYQPKYVSETRHITCQVDEDDNEVYVGRTVR